MRNFGGSFSSFVFRLFGCLFFEIGNGNNCQKDENKIGNNYQKDAVLFFLCWSSEACGDEEGQTVKRYLKLIICRLRTNRMLRMLDLVWNLARRQKQF